MKFKYSAESLVGFEKILQRFFEILPGAVSWSSLVGITLLSLTKPFAAAIVIIVFDLYWLFRLFYTTIFLVLSYRILSSESRTDWMKEIRALQDRRLQDISNPFRRQEAERFLMFEGHAAWATWAFLLTFIGWLPVLFASKQFSKDVLYYSTQRITGVIFNLSLLSFLVSVSISLLLLPKKRMRRPFFKKLWFAFEWTLVPLIAVFLSALPALDAQTRILFGRRLGFWVTDKKRIP